jgi:hypothetical protein
VFKSLFKFNPFRSMTTRGVLVGVGGYLWHHFDPTALGGTGPVIVEAIGAVLTVLGIRRRLEGPTPASGK